MKEQNNSAEIERIRSSIVTANPDDFVSRKRRFETVRKEPTPAATSIDSHISGFLSETNSMVENYEKEIELLRNKLSEMKEKESSAKNKTHFSKVN